MLDKLTLESFTPLVGSEFAISFSDGRYVMTLREAEAAQTGPRPASSPEMRAPFSLTFVGPGEFILPQSIYPLENATLGTLEVFIVPIGRDDSGVQYQAIFS